MARKVSARESIGDSFDPTVYAGDLAEFIEQADSAVFYQHNKTVSPIIVPMMFPGPTERGIHIRRILTYRTEQVKNKGVAALLKSATVESYIIWGKSVEKLAEDLLASYDPWKATGDAQFHQMLMLWALIAVRSRVASHRNLFPSFRFRTLRNILLDGTVPSDIRAEFFFRARTIPDSVSGNPRVLDARILSMICAIALERDERFEVLFHYLTNT